MNIVGFIAVGLMCVVAIGANVAFPATCERAWLAVANAVTFGWYRRLQERSNRRRRSEFASLAAMLDGAGLHEQACKVREIS